MTLVFAVAMYGVSGIVNNLTALLLVLPVLHVLLRLSAPSQRYVSWTLGALLVACNLGGAATPIGDFPAILLLGRGAMTFGDYLARALPQTLVALAILLAVVAFVARPGRDLDPSPLAARLALRTTVALHRRMRVDRRRLVPGAVALVGMLAAWSFLPPTWGVGPELVAWLGAAAAFFYGRWRRLSLWPTLDVLTPGLIVFLMAVSLAEFLGGAGYGSLTSIPWGINQFGVRRHAVQLYEIVAGLAALGVWWAATTPR